MFILQVFVTILLACTLLLSCHALSFSFTAPTECDPFNISWTGGAPPFTLLLLPVFDTPRSVDIPTTDENSLSLQLSLKADQQFIVTMSDASGFAAGGISSVLTVGHSIANMACSTATPPVPFLFDLPNELEQCQPFSFTWDDTAIKPVTITGIIPSGDFIQFNSGPTDTAFTWNPAAVQAGATMLFFLQDSQGKFGGTSHLLSVGNSDSNTCFNSKSPQSTNGNHAPAQTTSIHASGGPSPNSITQSNTNPSSTASKNPEGTSTSDVKNRKPSFGSAAIGGIIAGGVVALVAIGLVAYIFCIRKRNRKDDVYGTYSYDYLKPTPFTPSTRPLSPAMLQQRHADIAALTHQHQHSFPPSISHPYASTQIMSPEDNILQDALTGHHNESEHHPPLSYDRTTSRLYHAQQSYSPQGNPQPQNLANLSPSVLLSGATPSSLSVPSGPGMASHIPPSVLLAQQQTNQRAPPATRGGSHYRQTGPEDDAHSGRTYLQPPSQTTHVPIETPVQRLQPSSLRVIQHTDAEDEIIELPPQYNPHRGPGTDLGSSTVEGSASLQSDKM